MRFRLKERVGKHTQKAKDGKLTTYKAGDIIEVKAKVMLGNSLDKWEQLDPDEEVEGVPKGETAKKFKVKKIAGSKKYNVINVGTGEKINDEKLTKKEAQDLVGDME